jgi:hypothetical protein
MSDSPYPPMSKEREEDGTMSPRNDPVFMRAGICHTCTHIRKQGKCDAFPDGIPLNILVGNLIHNRPLPGDHGIQFEAKAI